MKIIAIDDNNDNLITLKAIIKDNFHDADVKTTISGKQGIELAQSIDPDVIILDIIMPGMDGYEICQILKSYEQTQDIPIIFLTALSENKENRLKALEVGGDAFLSKPIDQSELIAQIKAMSKLKNYSDQQKLEKINLERTVHEKTEELRRTHFATLNLLEDLREENETRKKKESELIESENSFRSLFEDSPVAIFEEDFSETIQWIQSYKDQGITNFRKFFQDNPEKLLECIHTVKILNVNRSAVDLFNAKDKQELFVSLPLMANTEDAQDRLDEFVNIAEGKSHFHLEIINNLFDKSRKYLSLHWGVVRGYEDDYSKVIISMVDITDRKLSEFALKESETRFRMLFDQAPVGYQSLNEDGIFIDVNQTWLDLLGYERTEVIGKRFGDFLSPNSVDNYKLCFTNFKEHGTIHSEFEMVKKNGSFIEIAFDGRIGYDQYGNFKQTHCVMQDVTESKRAEKGRRESEARYRSLFEDSPVSIWEEDFSYVKKRLDELKETGVEDFNEYFSKNRSELFRMAELIVVNDVNLETTKLFGANSKEELCSSFTNIYTEKTLDQLQEELVNIAKGKTYFDLDFTNKTIDGRVLEFTAKWAVVPGYENDLSKVLISMIDITDRKKAEEALRENEKRYRSLFDDSPVAIFEEDVSAVKRRINELKLSGIEDFREFLTTHPEELTRLIRLIKITDLNKEAEKLYGLESKEGFDGLIRQASTTYNIQLMVEEFAYIANGFTKFQTEINRYDEEGNIIYLSVNWAAVPGFEDDLSKVIVSVVDISERRELEKRQQQRLLEMEAIDKITTALREANTKEEALPIFLQETLTMMQVEMGSIWLYHPSNDALKISDAIAVPEIMKDVEIRTGEGLIGSVFLTGEMAQSQNILKESFEQRSEFMGDHPALGGVCVPIQTQEDILGVLVVVFPKDREVKTEEANLLQAFARIAGITLHRMTLHEDTLRHLRQLQVQRTIDQTIASIFDLNLTLEIICSQARNYLNADSVGILLFHPVDLSLNYVAASGFYTTQYKNARLQLGAGPAGKAALNRKIIHVEDIHQSDPPFKNVVLINEERIVSYLAAPLVAKGQLKGVLEIFYRTPNKYDPGVAEFIESLGLQTAIAIDNLQLFEDLQHSNLELVQAYDATIEGWSRAMDLRDKETENHTLRVTEMSMLMARKLGLSEEELVNLRRGALLHDIGKMGVPDEILHKPGPLTPEEWKIMKQHPIFAYEMISPVDYLLPALDIPYCHHEKWDGTGYPRGLSGMDIPLAGRIFAVIDVWDALSSDRPYRKAWPREKVLAYIKEQSGTHFDPQMVKIFLEIIESENGSHE